MVDPSERTRLRDPRRHHTVAISPSHPSPLNPCGGWACAALRPHFRVVRVKRWSLSCDQRASEAQRSMQCRRPPFAAPVGSAPPWQGLPMSALSRPGIFEPRFLSVNVADGCRVPARGVGVFPGDGPHGPHGSTSVTSVPGPPATPATSRRGPWRSHPAPRAARCLPCRTGRIRSCRRAWSRGQSRAAPGRPARSQRASDQP